MFLFAELYPEKTLFCTLLNPKAKNPAEKAVMNCIMPIAIKNTAGITFNLYNTKAAENKNKALRNAAENRVIK